MNIETVINSILRLAVQGKLVPQNPDDEPAAKLLEKIRAERTKLIKDGKIKKPKTSSQIFRRDGFWFEKIGSEEKCIDNELPFEIPESWEWVRLETLGEIVGGGTPNTAVKEYWEGGEIPWITPADMKNVKNKYIIKVERKITALGLQSSSARMIPANSLIFSTRAPIGHIGISANPVCTNQGFKSVSLYKPESINFLYYCIKALTSFIQERASGTTFKEISGSEYGKTLIPLPPLAEQARIAEKISQFMALAEDLDRALKPA